MTIGHKNKNGTIGHASFNAHDRRRAYRIRTPVFAYVRREDGKMERWDVENISTSGMLCIARRAYLGECVHLAVIMPGRCFEAIAARAVGVRHAKSGPPRIAIELTTSSDSYEDSVQDAITEQLERDSLKQWRQAA